MQKGAKYPVETLTADEASRLLRSCSSRSTTGLRNKALLTCLYRGGLRISEALSLLPKDLDVAANSVRVLNGKGNRSRIVALDAGAWAILQVWLDRRSTLGLDGRRPVFCTLKGGRMQRSYINTMLKRLAAKAGIEKRLHAHALRHSHACELAQENVPIPMIAQQLGHSNVATTSRYLDHIAPHARCERMRSREWNL